MEEVKEIVRKVRRDRKVSKVRREVKFGLA